MANPLLGICFHALGGLGSATFIWGGIAILVASVCVIGYGNYLGS